MPERHRVVTRAVTTTVQTIRRRAVSIPAMLGISSLAVVGFPLIVALATLIDLVRARFHLPLLRSYLFVLQYLVNDSIEIIAAPVLWAVAGFGRYLGGRASMRRHERLQAWSLRLLARRAEQLLGLRVDIVSGIEDLAPGPVILLSRHVSVIDASLPLLVCHRAGMSARGVVMAEMLADPGFDLIYQRTGSVFIPRDDGPTARAQVAAMARRGSEQTAYAIFPEGRLATAAQRRRALARLSETSPDRAERLAELEHLLPPRPGGVTALLEALPDADVVLLEHRGLERFPRMSKLLAAAPVNASVAVRLHRISRTEVPRVEAAQVEWLDQLWLDLDASVARPEPGEPRPNVRSGLDGD